MVRVMRFLFSAIMAGPVLGGELGVVKVFSEVEAERRDGVCIC